MLENQGTNKATNSLLGEIFKIYKIPADKKKAAVVVFSKKDTNLRKLVLFLSLKYSKQMFTNRTFKHEEENKSK